MFGDPRQQRASGMGFLGTPGRAMAGVAGGMVAGSVLEQHDGGGGHAQRRRRRPAAAPPALAPRRLAGGRHAARRRGCDGGLRPAYTPAVHDDLGGRRRFVSARRGLFGRRAQPARVGTEEGTAPPYPRRGRWRGFG
jgi:hypothetical protein